jgi:hypothetical protein
MSDPNKNINSQNNISKSLSQSDEDLRKDSELAEVNEELELSSDELDAIAGGTVRPAYGNVPLN